MICKGGVLHRGGATSNKSQLATDATCDYYRLNDTDTRTRVPMPSIPPTESSNAPANTDKFVGNSKLLGRMRDDIRCRSRSQVVQVLKSKTDINRFETDGLPLRNASGKTIAQGGRYVVGTVTR